MKRIASHTLGCKLNFAETSDLLNQFRRQGWTVVDFDSVADLYVVNTCTVTAVAEKKCRTIIRQAVATNPHAIIAVVGCFAQNAASDVSRINGVDIILGNDKKHTLLDEVNKFVAQQSSGVLIDNADPTSFRLSFSQEDRTRTFFKIQDGCDYFCSYCAIPHARGRSRSASVEETLRVAHEIAQTGAKEVVLTGINTGTFGSQHGESLLDLIVALDKIETIDRYRISSIEPNLLTDEIISFVAQSRAFLPHFHIPLQAGSDKVLRLMRRKYDTRLYAERVDKIRLLMPDACIAADVIAGFNGEDEATFAESLRFIDQLPLSYLHVFTFSERPNTSVLNMSERLDVSIRREHSKILHELSESKKSAFYRSQIGKVRPVLWESAHKDGFMFGFTDNYIHVRKPFDPASDNTIQSTLLHKLSDDELIFDGLVPPNHLNDN